MLWALNSDKRPVLIQDIESAHGHSFFCPRCKAQLSVVVPKKYSPYFRHNRDEACDFRGAVMDKRDYHRIFPDGDESKPQIVIIWCDRAQRYVYMLHSIRTFSMMRVRYNRQCFQEGLKRDFKKINGHLLPECAALKVGDYR